MLVGHNPGLEALAALLAREPVRRKERARHEALEEKFPTCALAILDFDAGALARRHAGRGQAGGFRAPERFVIRCDFAEFRGCAMRVCVRIWRRLSIESKSRAAPNPRFAFAP